MELISVFIFIFCAAMCAGSVLLISALLEEHPLLFLRSLFYYIIFISAFGFYGIWGQFIIVGIAGGKLSNEALSAISVISLLLGLPFLIFGWMMLIRFGADYAGLRFRGYVTAIFLILNFCIIGGLAFLVKDMEYRNALSLFKYYYSAASLIYSAVTAIVLAGRKWGTTGLSDRRSLAVTIVFSAMAQSAVLVFMPHSAWMALLFVFLVFAGIVLLPVYLKYMADLRVSLSPVTLSLPQGIEDFCRRHEISPREAEIIREICNGLSNQEIADKLFISLQTVKDHTSRIYSKTNVRSRMQLMTLVRSLNAR